jgi:aryl-alcohol dehydrogenase-like predicted oxidoreductase
MARLKEQGKVRWIGVSNFNEQQMKRAQSIAPITSLQPPYSMLQREIEESILPHAAATNVGVIVYSPMKNGLLSGRMTKQRVENLPEDDFRRRSPYFQEPRLSATLEMVAELGGMASRYNCTVGEIAIAWTLRHPAVTGAIVGLRNAGQVEGVIRAAELNIEAADFQQIEDLLVRFGL